MRAKAVLKTTALGATVALFLGCSSSPRPHADTSPPAALSRGVTWLLSQQSDDGAWRSKTYAAYAEGTTLTAAVLWALTACPPGSVPPEPLDRAAAWLRRRIDAKGALPAELPTYATALAVVALSRLSSREDPDVQRLAHGLLSSQLAEPLGWQPADRAYGGWDRQGAWAARPNLSQADLSLAAFSVEALAAADVPGTDPVLRHALGFVDRCRQKDGGFLATPEERLAWVNKAGEATSYSTATCDGVRVLLACGGNCDSSGAWLDAHSRADAPEGLRAEWTEGLRFYHAFVSTRARRLLGRSIDLAWLAPLQRTDGSWANAQPLMKEDDPLIATLLSVAALADSVR